MRHHDKRQQLSRHEACACAYSIAASLPAVDGSNVFSVGHAGWRLCSAAGNAANTWRVDENQSALTYSQEHGCWIGKCQQKRLCPCYLRDAAISASEPCTEHPAWTLSVPHRRLSTAAGIRTSGIFAAASKPQHHGGTLTFPPVSQAPCHATLPSTSASICIMAMPRLPLPLDSTYCLMPPMPLVTTG